MKSEKASLFIISVNGRYRAARNFIRIAGRQCGISLPGRAGKRSRGRKNYESRSPPKMAEIGFYLSEPPSLSNYASFRAPESCPI